MLAAIKAGHAKAFVPEAAVYHSHDFGVWETALQRNFDEASSFQRDFGYQVQPSLVRALASSVLLARRDARWMRQANDRGVSWLKHCAYMGGIELARTPGAVSGHPAPATAGLAVGCDLARPWVLQRGRSA